MYFYKSMLGKVFKNSFWYSFSSILLRASSIIFFPIFSAYLTKADYGILSVTQGIIVWLTAIIGMELHNCFVRYLNTDECNSDSEYKSKVIGNILMFSSLSFVVCLIVLMLLGEKAFNFLLNDIDYYPYMFFSLVGLVFTFIVNLYRFYLKSIQKGRLSFWYDMGFFASNILLNLFFVVVLKMDVIGIIYSTIICGVVFTIIAIYNFSKAASFTFDRIILTSLLRYSLPLVPFILFGMGVETISTFFLNKEIGKEATGIFYIAVTLAAVFSTIKESVLAAISPWFFEFYENHKNKVYEIVNLLIWGGAICCFLISVFSLEVLEILSNNEELVVSWKYVPILLIGYLIVFVGQIYNLPVYYLKTKNNRLIFGSALGFFGTFIFCYFFAKHGIIAAVISKTIGYSLMTFVFLILARLMGFKVDYLRLLLILAIFIPLFFLNYLPINYVYLLVLKCIVSVVIVLQFGKKILKKYVAIKRKYIIFRNLIKIKLIGNN